MSKMKIVCWEGDSHMVKIDEKEAAYIYQNGPNDDYSLSVRFLDKDISFSPRQLRKIADFMEGRDGH